MTSEYIGLFLLLSGYIIGLGAVTVIDLHGFFGRTSSYWTEATIRTHKVTKPLIWIGITLAIIGGMIYYSSIGWHPLNQWQAVAAIGLIANGSYLSFVISPYLLAQEQAGKASELLPKKMQRYITISFLFSVTLWWGSLALLVLQLV